ncbi:MAG TPA: hypothetical protein H9919_05755, partial [Candidatus Alistipes excrementipullorum]|nr:hypothetical protein [Candidatus Alistipes excrementipullorum]
KNRLYGPHDKPISDKNATNAYIFLPFRFLCTIFDTPEAATCTVRTVRTAAMALHQKAAPGMAVRIIFIIFAA